jgi:hypothetical protein
MLHQKRPRLVGETINQRARTFGGDLPIVLIERAPVPMSE